MRSGLAVVVAVLRLHHHLGHHRRCPPFLPVLVAVLGRHLVEVLVAAQVAVQAEVRSGGLDLHRLIQRERTRHLGRRLVMVDRHLAGADQGLA